MKLNNLWMIDSSKIESIIDSYKENDNKAILLENGKYQNSRVVIRDDVAIIKIEGVISKDYDSFNYFYYGGSASLNDLAQDFYNCLKNESISAIIFDIDSPGGVMSGVNEFSEIIFNSRGIKPIIAYTNGIAASAAYYIASACDEIVIDKTGGVGSIGVIKTFYSGKKDTISFVSSQSKNKNIDPDTDKGKEIYQSQVDELAEVFLDHVSKYRKISKEEIMKGGDYGSVVYGKKAIDSRLCDKFGSLESLISSNTKIKKLHGGFMNNNIKVSAETETEQKDNSEQEAMLQAAYEKGIKEERERVVALQKIKIVGTEEIIQSAIASGLNLDQVNAEIISFIQNNTYGAAEITLLSREKVVEAVKPVVAEEEQSTSREENLQKIIGLVNRR